MLILSLAIKKGKKKSICPLLEKKNNFFLHLRFSNWSLRIKLTKKSESSEFGAIYHLNKKAHRRKDTCMQPGNFRAAN